VLLALFGPAVPVAVLAAAARAWGGDPTELGRPVE
jgi:hypothetical protein